MTGGIVYRAMRAQDGRRVLAIYGDSILNEDCTVVTAVPDWREWDSAHDAACRLVAAENDRAVAFAAVRGASDGVGEVSIYVDRAFRGIGIGQTLLKQFAAVCERGGYRLLRSKIFPENHASIAVHRRAGFAEIGISPRGVCKNGVWRDVIIYERASIL
ncbi:MAG: GNAT family N-acetyltransferase [Oscillospiraceae bacterium]